MRKVLSGLRDVVENNIFNLTLILNDPTGNSYIQFLDETGHDENLSIELYDRTDEENETFGLNHNPDESN
ncbi:hypothetical protein A3Q56_04655 [Intoshia linei]|uniref:ZPR1 jelly-roll domain-containing protein n=1 Tax=Intoshia linei TaxID=1819745 RepID=A0A177AZW1_9BILA|nr:hypothetical protein A3Q56_04655 [Intoshia linei]